MEKVLSMPSVLTEERITEKALERLEKEHSDFLSYKGTEMFDKLLGIYKPKQKTKTEKDENGKFKTVVVEKEEIENEAFVYNENLSTYGQFFADGVCDSVYKTLKGFITANVYFAAAFLKSKGNFTGCLAFAIHGFIPDDVSDTSKKTIRNRFYMLSDYEVYREAVRYYFAGSDVSFKMEIVNPKGFNDISVTEDDIKVNPDYEYALTLANAQQEARKRAAAEAAEKAKKAEAERKAKEEKRKKREAEKKKKEELKKAQQSLFTVDESDSDDKLPTPKILKVEPKSKKSAFTFDDETQVSDIKELEISLF